MSDQDDITAAITGQGRNMLDYERSLALAQKMSYRYDPQCCWANAVQSLRLYQKQLGNVVYVEGWCTFPELPSVQEHGWLELEDGTILDPTYAVMDNEDRIQLYREYFPALYYRPDALKGVRIRSLPLVHKTDGFGGLRNESYRAAYVTAYRRIGVEIDLNLNRGHNIFSYSFPESAKGRAAMNEQDDINTAIASIRSRLDTLASINTANILIPGGPQERYHAIIEEAYAALGLIETQVDELRTELEYQHKRLDEIRDAALSGK